MNCVECGQKLQVAPSDYIGGWNVYFDCLNCGIRHLVMSDDTGKPDAMYVQRSPITKAKGEVPE